MRDPILRTIAVLAVAAGASVGCSDHPSIAQQPAGATGSGGIGASGASSGGDGGSGAGFNPTGSASGGATTGSGGGRNCGETTAEATLAPANILFVVDRSGSMNCNPPPLQTSSACELDPTTTDPGQPTKWDIVSQALVDAIAAMPPTTSVGVAFFNNDDACGVSQVPAVSTAPIDAAQLAAISASIQGIVPKGATPIVGGVTLGYAHLHYDVALEGNDFVVLITDGAETCAEHLQDKLVNETVPQAQGVGIRTFVIGAPGSDPARALLSRIAWEGGTAKDPQCTHDPLPANVGDCHIDLTDPNVDFATEIVAALEKVSGEALSCEFDVPDGVGQEVDYDKVNVDFTAGDGTTEGFSQDNAPCGMADGWQYSADKKKIVLCGAACDLVKSDPMGKITITLGCQTVVR